MGYFCGVCHKTIRFESKIKHLQNHTQGIWKMYTTK